MNNVLKRFNTVINFSSIDKVKELAKLIGWNGKKTEKDRKFLSDLKILTTNYNDMPFNSMQKQVNEFNNDECDAKLLFLHIREPKEIERAKKEFGARTILITRDSVKHITSNVADNNVFNYKYDITIPNNGTIEDLHTKAVNFIKNLGGVFE